MPEFGDLLPGHGEGHKGGPLVGIVCQVLGHGAVFLNVIIQFCARERGDGMKVGNVRIQLQSKLDGFQAVCVGLSGDAKEKWRIDCQADFLGSLYCLFYLGRRDALANGIEVLLYTAFSAKQYGPATSFLKGFQQGLIHLVDYG